MTHLESDSRILIDILSDLLSMSNTELLTSRAGLTPYARAIIAKKLLECGYTKSQAAKALKRNHATIITAIKKLDDALSTQGYDDIRELVVRFEEKISSSNTKLLGVTPDKCVWNVKEEDRLCTICIAKNCIDRKTIV